MTTNFNREQVREITKKVKEVLSEYFKDSELDAIVKRATYSDDKLSLTVDFSKKDGNKTFVSDYTNKICNNAASKAGCKFVGNFIGTIWSVDSKGFLVKDYVNSRRKYPITIQKEDGTTAKCGFDFLKGRKQLMFPTASAFSVWFTLDPDSDKVRESDVEIYDNVQSFMQLFYTEEDGIEKFFDVVDKLNEKGIANKKMARDIHKTLQSKGLSEAYVLAKKYYRGQEVK